MGVRLKRGVKERDMVPYRYETGDGQHVLAEMPASAMLEIASRNLPARDCGKELKFGKYLFPKSAVSFAPDEA